MEIVRALRDLLYRGTNSISFPGNLLLAIPSAKTTGTSRPCRNGDSLPWCRSKMLLRIPFFTCHSGARRRDQAAGNETVPRPSAKKTPHPSWTEGGTWRAPWCRRDGFLFWRGGAIPMHKGGPGSHYDRRKKSPRFSGIIQRVIASSCPEEQSVRRWDNRSRTIESVTSKQLILPRACNTQGGISRNE